MIFLSMWLILWGHDLIHEIAFGFVTTGFDTFGTEVESQATQARLSNGLQSRTFSNYSPGALCDCPTQALNMPTLSGQLSLRLSHYLGSNIMTSFP